MQLFHFVVSANSKILKSSGISKSISEALGSGQTSGAAHSFLNDLAGLSAHAGKCCSYITLSQGHLLRKEG